MGWVVTGRFMETAKRTRKLIRKWIKNNKKMRLVNNNKNLSQILKCSPERTASMLGGMKACHRVLKTTVLQVRINVMRISKPCQHQKHN